MGQTSFVAAAVVDFSEAVDDRLAALLVQGTGITLTYNDVANTLTISSSGGGGVTDHGTLTGLADDDHPQYHTDARGDLRYSALGHTHAQYALLVGAAFTGAVSVSPTWNNVATAFDALLINVTDTASAAASDLIDAKVGGSSRFRVDKTGTVFPSGNIVLGNSTDPGWGKLAVVGAGVFTGLVQGGGFFSTGHVTFATDNTHDIGASGATRPRHVYVGTNITAGGTVAATKHRSGVWDVYGDGGGFFYIERTSDGLQPLKFSSTGDVTLRELVYINATSSQAGFVLQQAGASKWQWADIGSRMWIFNYTTLSEAFNINATTNDVQLFGALGLAVKTIATLPSAAAYANKRFIVSDSAVRGGRIAYSDGSVWSYENGTAV